MLGDFLLLKRNLYKIFLENEINCSSELKMLAVTFGEPTMSKTRVYEQYRRFKGNREDIKLSGRPSTSTIDSNVKQVKEIILENRRILSVKLLIRLVYCLAHVNQFFPMFSA